MITFRLIDNFIYLYSFFNLVARRVWLVKATPRLLYPRERTGTQCIGGQVSPRTGLDSCGKSRHHRDSILGPSSPWRVAISTTLSRPTMFGWTTDIVLGPVNAALEAEKIHFSLNLRNQQRKHETRTAPKRKRETRTASKRWGRVGRENNITHSQRCVIEGAECLCRRITKAGHRILRVVYFGFFILSHNKNNSLPNCYCSTQSAPQLRHLSHRGMSFYISC